MYDPHCVWGDFCMTQLRSGNGICFVWSQLVGEKASYGCMGKLNKSVLGVTELRGLWSFSTIPMTIVVQSAHAAVTGFWRWLLHSYWTGNLTEQPTWLRRDFHIWVKNVENSQKYYWKFSLNIRCTHEVCTQTYSWGASAPLLWTCGGPTAVHGSIWMHAG